jgi:ligand-binding sensor domain-containing protein
MSVLFKKKGFKAPENSKKLFSDLFLLFFLLKVFLPGNLPAQPQDADPVPKHDLKFQHITVADGLPENTVKWIIQDHLGFLWLSTQNGLVKYDGYTFTTYMYEPGEPGSTTDWISHSLSDRNLMEILEDHLGNIWVGTMSGGLNRFNRETETFTHYRHYPEDTTSLSHDGAYTIYEDRSGVLWIGTGGGLNKFDREMETFIHYRHNPRNPHTLSDDVVYSMLEDRRGNFWVGTSNGLNRFDRKSGTFTRYLHNPDDSASLSHNIIAAIYEDKAGGLWIGTTNGGLNRFDYETETFLHYQYDSENPYSLSHNNVFSILEDHRGNFWVGTYGGGLNKFDRKTRKFHSFYL